MGANIPAEGGLSGLGCYSMAQEVCGSNPAYSILFSGNFETRRLVTFDNFSDNWKKKRHSYLSGFETWRLVISGNFSVEEQKEEDDSTRTVTKWNLLYLKLLDDNNVRKINKIAN